MGVKGFLLGGLLGFGIGLYQGYNYADEQARKECMQVKNAVAYERVYKYDGLAHPHLERIISDSEMITYVRAAADQH